MNFETYSSRHIIEMNHLKIIIVGFWMRFLVGSSKTAVTRSPVKTTTDATQITDFKEFIKNHRSLYVDKTIFLSDFVDREEENKGPVVFVTRPPGFGKSLLASTVDYFFNSKYDASQSKLLFSGLHVMTDTLAVKQFREEHMNRFPVIKISFASVTAGDFHGALEEIERIFKQVIEDHATVVNHFNDTTLDRIANYTADEKCLQEFVKLLSGYVIDHHRQDPILIIDAYDTPLYSAYAAGYYDQMAEFMDYFFDGVFNDGYYRFKKAFISGVATVELDRIRLHKEASSGKPDDYNPISGFFGFTKEEVELLFARNGKGEDNYCTLVENFGGYGFRDFNVTMFNPSGVIRYFDKDTLDGGIHAASTSILKDLFTDKRNGLYPILSVQKLLANESTPRSIIEQLHYPSIDKISSHYWTFLMSFGFATKDLKTVPNKRRTRDSNKIVLKIPNLTIHKVLAQLLAETPGVLDYNSFTESLIQGDFERVKTMLKAYVKNAGPYVINEDKCSEKNAHSKHTRLFDYVNDLLQGVNIRYKTNSTTLHLPGFDYIELEPSGSYKYRIRVRIEKTKMLKATWNKVRNKVCSLVRTVPKEKAEIFIQYGAMFVDVCLRPFEAEYRLDT